MQEILSSIWLEVIGSDELKCNNLETKKTEKQVVSSDRWWQVEEEHTWSKKYSVAYGNDWSVVTIWRATNLKQEILSSIWLGMIGSGMLTSNTLATRNTE